MRGKAAFSQAPEALTYASYLALPLNIYDSRTVFPLSAF